MASRWGSPPRAPTGTTHHCSHPALAAAIGQLGGALPGQRTCHLDAGYDSWPTRQLLTHLGFAGQIAHLGVPAPFQASKRWPVERTSSWMNGYGKLRRMTDRNAKIVESCLYLAAAFITVRQPPVAAGPTR